MRYSPREKLVKSFEEALVRSFLAVFGDRLVSLVLHGSYARGDFREDSDVDVIVILNGVVDRYALHLELDRVGKLLPLPSTVKGYAVADSKHWS